MSLVGRKTTYAAPAGSRAAKVHATLLLAVFAVFAAHGSSVATGGTLEPLRHVS